MLLSYYHKLSAEPPAGRHHRDLGARDVRRSAGWSSTSTTGSRRPSRVLSVLLLELKKGLEGLTKHVASNEIITVAKFLVLAVVILPIVPDRELTRFHLNPFKTWLVVVAVSGVSFASYVAAARAQGARRRRAVRGPWRRVFVDGDDGRARATGQGGAAAEPVRRQHPDRLRRDVRCGWCCCSRFFNRGARGRARARVRGARRRRRRWPVGSSRDGATATPRHRATPRAEEPARAQGGVPVRARVRRDPGADQPAREYLGRAGLYSLAAIMGVTDVDPFILGLAQGGAARRRSDSPRRRS